MILYRLIGLVGLMVSIAIPLTSQSNSVLVRGTVKSDLKESLPLVNVYIKGTMMGTATDSTGSFRLFLPRGFQGSITFSLLGYEKRTVTVRADRDTITFHVILFPDILPMKEVLVTGTFTTGESKVATLNTLEVVSTPGTAADIYHAVKMFPGVTPVDESAGLYVRGGDANETLTYVNNGLLPHPYQSESPYQGNTFGLIDVFLVKGVTFSSGGFPVKYGNAMSGLLLLETRDIPQAPLGILNLSLASGGIVGGTSMWNEQWGLRASARKTFTNLFFRLNDVPVTFIETPSSQDGSISLVYDDGNKGKIRTFQFFSSDKVVALTHERDYSGRVLSKGNNQFHNVYASKIFSDRVYVETMVAYNHFVNDLEIGIRKTRVVNDVISSRLDASVLDVWNPARLGLSFGAEFIYDQGDLQGEFPSNPRDNRPGASTETISQFFVSRLAAGYVQTEWRLWRDLLLIGGLRHYYHHPAKRQATDLRTSLGYALSSDQSLRFSLGTHHQYPSNAIYASTPDVLPARALNTVIGYEYRGNKENIRVEVYNKQYARRLASRGGRLTNEGEAFARGVDLFMKGKVSSWLLGWLSYSYLKTGRRIGSHGSFYPSSQDVTHALTIVSQVILRPFLYLGLNYRYATGKPFTPLLEPPAEFNGEYWIPRFSNDLNSARLPGYSRLDATLTYLHPLTAQAMGIIYFSVSNVFDTPNLQRYEYSDDYREKKGVLHPGGIRTYYFGFSLSHNFLQ